MILHIYKHIRSGLGIMIMQTHCYWSKKKKRVPTVLELGLSTSMNVMSDIPGHVFNPTEAMWRGMLLPGMVWWAPCTALLKRDLRGMFEHWLASTSTQWQRGCTIHRRFCEGQVLLVVLPAHHREQCFSSEFLCLSCTMYTYRTIDGPSLSLTALPLRAAADVCQHYRGPLGGCPCWQGQEKLADFSGEWSCCSDRTRRFLAPVSQQCECLSPIV